MTNPPSERPRGSDEYIPGVPGNIPPSVRLWISIAQAFGLPTLLVAYFLAQQAGMIGSETRDITNLIKAHIRQSEIEHEESKDIRRELIEVMKGLQLEIRSINRVMRAVCATSSNLPDVRRACLGEPQ